MKDSSREGSARWQAFRANRAPMEAQEEVTADGRWRSARRLRSAQRRLDQARRRDEGSLESFLAALVRYERACSDLSEAPGLDGWQEEGPDVTQFLAPDVAGGGLDGLLEELAEPAGGCSIESRQVWRRFCKGLLQAALRALLGAGAITGPAVVAGLPPRVVCGVSAASLLFGLAREAAPVVVDLVRDVDGVTELVDDYELLVEAQIALRSATAAWLDAQTQLLIGPEPARRRWSRTPMFVTPAA